MKISKFFIFMFFLMTFVIITSISYASRLSESEVFRRKENFFLNTFEHGKKKQLGSLPKGVLNILNVEIGQDSLSYILERLGDAYITKEGGESGSFFLCYHSKDSANKIVVLFESGTSGSWQTIDGIALLQDYSFLFGRCTPQIYISKTIKFGNGLRLGMSETELTSIMGDPSFIKGEWKGYIYTGKRKIEEKKYDVIVSILVRIIDSSVVEIWIKKGEWS